MAAMENGRILHRSPAMSDNYLLNMYEKALKLPAGRKTVKLPPVSLGGLPPGTVAVEYQLYRP